MAGTDGAGGRAVLGVAVKVGQRNFFAFVHSQA